MNEMGNEKASEYARQLLNGVGDPPHFDRDIVRRMVEMAYDYAYRTALMDAAQMLVKKWDDGLPKAVKNG